MVCSYNPGKYININKLSVTLNLENTEYGPEQFPGLVYRIKDPKIVVLIFSSGKIILTGAGTLKMSRRGLISSNKSSRVSCKRAKHFLALLMRQRLRGSMPVVVAVLRAGSTLQARAQLRLFLLWTAGSHAMHHAARKVMTSRQPPKPFIKTINHSAHL